MGYLMKNPDDEEPGKEVIRQRKAGKEGRQRRRCGEEEQYFPGSGAGAS